MRKLVPAAGLSLVLALGVAAPAHAQTFFTPFAGATFGGDAPAKKFSTGASLTFMGRVAGLELEFGYTPDFFGEQTDFALVADSNVTNFMANLMVGPGVGRVRPYGVGGVGLMRTRVNTNDLFDDVATNDFALNLGGGVFGLISDHVGVRGDVRYFRRLQDPSNDNDFDVALGKFNFWRAYGGVTFKF